MSKENKKTKKKSLYIIAAIFSVVWVFLVQLPEITKSFDDKWSDARLILPMYLSVPFTADGNYAFAFGKYINKPADPRITVTAIDDYTVDKYGYPFKRKYYGQLIEKLKGLGVKAIGMDVMFFESDKDEPASDARFLAASEKAGIVVNLLAIEKDRMTIKKPMKGVGTASAYMAYPNSDISLDGDGHARKFYLFFPGRDNDLDGFEDQQLLYKNLELGRLKCSPLCDEVKLASLGMATYAVYTGKPLLDYERLYSENPMTLNYRYPVYRKAHPGWDKNAQNRTESTFRHVSVADILENRLSQEEKDSLKGGMTLIGSTALGAYDHFPSPFSALLPGVEIHATCIDNLLLKDSLRSVSGGYLALLMLILPWIPVFLNRYPLNTMVAVSSGIMFLMLVLDYVFLCNLYSVPFISVALSFLIPSVYVAVDKGLLEGREKKWIKNTFGQYLSPKVVEIITKDPSKLSLGGEKRDMTAMFCDIAGFTTISEQLTPEQLTAMLNTYLSGLTDVILQQDGVVDKFIGDCIMAFWNAPLDLKNHRTSALLAAVDCLAVNNKLNELGTDMVVKPCFRIGLNSGPMTVGNMGSKNRFSYTVIGDAVNLASRLEGANKFFHSRIMASEDVFNEGKDQLEARYLGQIRVVGKAIPVKVYEPLTRKGGASPEIMKMLQRYGAGVENFSAGKYMESAKDFKAALEANPGDGPSQFYLELAEQYNREIPKDWDGAFNLTSK